MGIDLLEITIEIEKAFGFDLERDFWKRETTFGDVIDEVMRRYEKAQIQMEIATGYDETLKELCEEVKKILPMGCDIDENTRLAKIVPFWRRHRFWRLLRERFLMLEPLKAYQAQQMIRVLGIEPIFFFGGIIFCSLSNVVQNLILRILCGLLGVIGIIGFFVTFPLALRTHFVMPCKRIGDLARMIADRRQRFERLQQGSQAEFENTLREIFCRVLFIKPEKVTREAALYKDLGVE